MMLKYISLLFLITPLLVLSQNWIRQGAEWHYYSNGEGLRVYHHMKLEGDVIISGKTYQKVFNQRYLYFPTSPYKDTLTNYGSESFLYRMNGDTLFQLIHLQDTTFEDIVMIFRDQAHWQSTSNLNDTLCTQIPDYTSTFYNTEAVNGITDSIFFVTVSNVYNREDFTMGPYSRIFGSKLRDFTPRYDCIHEISVFSIDYQLLCYQDDEGFSIKNTLNECDYYLMLNTGELSSNNISIYPNPAKSKVTIQSEIEFDEVNLYDLQGKKFPVQLDFNLKQIDINNFKSGIYFLEIISGQMKKTEKLMIE